MNDMNPMDPGVDKRSLIEDLLKLVSEHRAMGLKSKLSPEPAANPQMDDPSAPEMPGDPEMPDGEGEGGSEGEPDPEMLKKLLEMMGGDQAP